jgi:two-component system OmpR family sensor kinase
MASLRSRVLASVLLLAAAGLILLAAVTYAEQRSFLLDRVDQQVKASIPAVSLALDHDGFLPASSTASKEDQGESQSGSGEPSSGSHTGSGSHSGGPGPNLPPGTYAQRMEPSGEVIGHTLITYGQTAPPAPILPVHPPIDTLFTVPSAGSSGLHYRVYVSHDPEDKGLTLVAVPLHEVEQTLSRLLLVEGLVIVGVLIALGVSAYFVVRIGLRPLDRIEVTAGEIAGGELSRRVSPATSKTEVGRLGLALNAMLDRLEQAFARRTESEERLRRFLADASHELRTPLASIRGYAELFRMGAADDRESTELAMRRIEEEAARMGVLVEDLLSLARLDEAPEAQHEQVDLTELASDAVLDARATASDRRIELSSTGPALLLGDAHQLRQVLANLMRNAVVHTPAGSPIEVTVESDGTDVSVRVRDHGPGIPPGAHENLFDRFWRSEAGRGRGKAGAGLGLAIAYEVVVAHHGSISAEDPPGGGAMFVVRLPAAAPERAPAAAR